MANKRIEMHTIKKIYNLHHQGWSKLKISQRLQLSRNTVKKYIRFLKDQNFTAHEIAMITDSELLKLFRGKECGSKKGKELQTYFPYFEKELKRVGVSKHLLWLEYKQRHPDGLMYSMFCNYYREWKRQSQPVMRFDHKAGDKMFVDFTGKKLHIVDKARGELKELEVFVSVLGASQLTYVEAVESQTKQNFIACTENALLYYGGVPMSIVTDNLKAAVHKSNKYEPSLNETFADFARHYDTTILATRAYKPKDKAIVEGAVKIVYGRIYATLRDQTFYSLEQINTAIWEQLEIHNGIPFRSRPHSRRDLFKEIELPALQSLPTQKYELKHYGYATVIKNCHIFLNKDKHYYSVPHHFIGKKVKIIYSPTKVEIYRKQERIALHQREYEPYGYTTIRDHLPANHRFVKQWSAEFFIEKAEAVGADCKTYILKILDLKQHPEQSYKSCFGILNLAKKAGDKRLDKACKRALDFEAYSYHTIKNILENGWDKLADEDKSEATIIPIHPNIRGKEYYQ